MAKKRHLDFMIADNEDEKIMFRFYPKQSHMHGFSDEPPKSKGDVYKVYYTWAIFRTWGGIWTNEPKFEPWQEMFRIELDECSALEWMEAVVRDVIDKEKDMERAESLGQPGSEWEIRRKNDILEFLVFDNWTDRGFRFWLTVRKAEEFCGYLQDINQHMLENGEPC